PHRRRHAHSTAGGARLRRHRLPPDGRAGGVRRDAEDLHDPGRPAHRGLHHGTVRLMEHTSRHYEMELVELKEKILFVGGMVEEMIGSAMRSLLDRDPELARQVIDSDPRVDVAELEVDHLCLNLLALRQPAASDLRFIATALKIVTYLERVADHATNIAQMVIFMCEGRDVRHPGAQKRAGGES